MSKPRNGTPHNPQAEEALIGCLLRDPKIIADMLPIVRPEAFYSFRAQAIYQAVVTVYAAGNVVDPYSVGLELNAKGRLEDVGAGYITELLDDTLSTHNWRNYADAVREEFINRSLIYIANEIVINVTDKVGPSSLILADAEKQLAKLSIGSTDKKAVHIGEIIQRVVDEISKRRENGGDADAVNTGFMAVDSVLGGMRRQNMIVLGGRPSQGKSALGMQIAENVAEAGEVTLFVSLEMSESELGERMLSGWSNVSSNMLRNGRIGPSEADSMTRAMAKIGALSLYVSDMPSGTIQTIQSESRRLAMRHPLRLIVVDYLQRIHGDRSRPRHEQVGEISRGLKSLAKELDVTVLALCQLNRASENREGGRPRLADLRESGDIEQDADTVLLIHRPERTQPETEIIVAKNRMGPIDTVPLVFDMAYCRFRSVENPIGFASSGTDF